MGLDQELLAMNGKQMQVVHMLPLVALMLRLMPRLLLLQQLVTGEELYLSVVGRLVIHHIQLP